MIGDRVETEGLELRETGYEPGASMSTHAHRETCVTLVLAGGIEETVGSRSRTAGPAWIGIKPAQVEHSDVFYGSASTMKLRLYPRFLARLEGRTLPVDTWRWIPAGAAAPTLTRMLRRLRAATMSDAPWLEDHALELLAALDDDGRLRPRPAPPRWLGRVRRRVLDGYLEGVRTSELAGEVGVHPVHLARLFRRHFGESISDCVRRRRVRSAARRLADTDEAISRIAYATGFADQSHMTRTFRRETGVPPGAWRSAARRGLARR